MFTTGGKQKSASSGIHQVLRCGKQKGWLNFLDFPHLLNFLVRTISAYRCSLTIYIIITQNILHLEYIFNKTLAQCLQQQLFSWSDSLFISGWSPWCFTPVHGFDTTKSRSNPIRIIGIPLKSMKIHQNLMKFRISVESQYYPIESLQRTPGILRTMQVIPRSWPSAPSSSCSTSNTTRCAAPAPGPSDFGDGDVRKTCFTLKVKSMLDLMDILDIYHDNSAQAWPPVGRPWSREPSRLGAA